MCVCVSILFNRANYSLTSMLSACGYQCAAFVCVPNQTPRWFFPFKSGLRGRFSRCRGVSGRTGDRSAAAARGGGRGGRRKKKENFSTKSRENATDTCCERGVWVNESVCVLCFHIYVYQCVWRGERTERGHRVRTGHALARHRTKKKKKSHLYIWSVLTSKKLKAVRRYVSYKKPRLSVSASGALSSSLVSACVCVQLGPDAATLLYRRLWSIAKPSGFVWSRCISLKRKRKEKRKISRRLVRRRDH